MYFFRLPWEFWSTCDLSLRKLKPSFVSILRLFLWKAGVTLYFIFRPCRCVPKVQSVNRKVIKSLQSCDFFRGIYIICWLWTTKVAPTIAYHSRVRQFPWWINASELDPAITLTTEPLNAQTRHVWYHWECALHEFLKHINNISSRLKHFRTKAICSRRRLSRTLRVIKGL